MTAAMNDDEAEAAARGENVGEGKGAGVIVHRIDGVCPALALVLVLHLHVGS